MTRLLDKYPTIVALKGIDASALLYALPTQRSTQSLQESGLSTAPLASGQRRAGGGAVDNSAPFVIRPESTYKSGKVVQTNGATSMKVVQGEPEFERRGV